MAKRVKTKKGSIGKKALAAILAASMVLSSSAFSVLAAGQVEEVSPAGVEEVSLGDSPMIVAAGTNDENWAFNRVAVDPIQVELPMGRDAKVSLEEIKRQLKVYVKDVGTDDYTELTEGDSTSNHWGYTVETAELDDSFGSQYVPVMGAEVAQGEDYDYWNKDLGKDILSKRGNGNVTCTRTTPHIHIKLTFNGPSEASTYDAGDWFDVPITILPRNLSNLEANQVKLTWEGSNSYIYDGTYQYPKLKKVEIYPDGDGNTDTAYTLDADQFELQCETCDDSVIGSVDSYCNQVGEHKLHVVAKSSLKNYTGEVGVKELTILPAEFKNGTTLVKAVVKPVTAKPNGRDMISDIEKNVSVQDVVLMHGNVVDGQELFINDDFIVCFPDANGNYNRTGNNWETGTPDNTIGTPHKLAIIATENNKNYKKDSLMEVEYEVYPDSDLRQIVKNAKLGDFKDDDKDGEFEAVYDGTNQYNSKNGANLVLRDGVKTMVEGKDYQVYGTKNWTNAGQYVLTIVGKGDYRGQKDTITVNILPKPLWENGTNGKLNHEFTATFLQSEMEYGTYGSVIPEIEWTDNTAITNKILSDTNDYSVSVRGYDSNDHRFREIEITGKGNYTTEWTNGSQTGSTVTISRDEANVCADDDGLVKNKANFEYEEHLDLRDECIHVRFNKNWTWKDISKRKIEISEKDITVTDASSNNAVLKLGYDYEIVGAEPVEIGKVSVSNVTVGSKDIQLRGVAKPDGSGKQYCTVHARTESIAIAAKSTFKADYVADPINDIPRSDDGIIPPEPKVHETGSSIQYDEVERYEYWYADGSGQVPKKGDKLDADVGDYVVRIIPSRKEYDEADYIEVPFRVVGENLTEVADIVVSTENVVYDGTEKRQAVTVTLKDVNKTPLYENIDYEVKYDDCINAGTVTGTIVGIGYYYGEYPISFTIEPAPINDAVITAEKQAFTQTPTMSVVVDGRSLTAGTDYTITSVTQSEDGTTATVTIEGTGNYTGTATTTFEIEEGGSVEPTPTPTPPTEEIKTPTITLSNKISKTKKTFTVTSCKVAGATQWQVQYSLKNTFNANGNLKSSKTKTITKANRLYRQKITCNKSGKRYYVRVRAYVNGDWSEWSDTAEGLEQIKSR